MMFDCQLRRDPGVACSRLVRHHFRVLRIHKAKNVLAIARLTKTPSGKKCSRPVNLIPAMIEVTCVVPGDFIQGNMTVKNTKQAAALIRSATRMLKPPRNDLVIVIGTLMPNESAQAQPASGVRRLPGAFG
jgi:hypothetical protein